MRRDAGIAMRFRENRRSANKKASSACGMEAFFYGTHFIYGKYSRRAELIKEWRCDIVGLYADDLQSCAGYDKNIRCLGLRSDKREAGKLFSIPGFNGIVYKDIYAVKRYKRKKNWRKQYEHHD